MQRQHAVDVLASLPVRIRRLGHGWAGYSRPDRQSTPRTTYTSTAA
jgi:hypothetical protein